MILDKENLFSDEQVVTATAVSTNSIDMGAAGADPGPGENIFVEVLVEEALDAAGSAVVTVEVITAEDAALTTNVVAVQTLGTLARYDAAGVKLVKRLMPSVALKRYFGLRYTLATGPLTAGKISGFLVKDPDLYKQYPDAITIG